MFVVVDFIEILCALVTAGVLGFMLGEKLHRVFPYRKCICYRAERLPTCEDCVSYLFLLICWIGGLMD